jgi:hypothetical protein
MSMATCEACGNEYDRPLVVVQDGHEHVFDSFECAIHRMAPTCEQCGCRVIGHGVQVAEEVFCCARCARAAGRGGVGDRA